MEEQRQLYFPKSKISKAQLQEWTKKQQTLISVSKKRCLTDPVSRLAFRSMSLRNSRLSAEDVVDKRGTSNGGPKSTSKAQRPSQARLPLIAEKSPSAVGFDKLSNSFPILSACLWKNRWRTTTSVSSDVVPSQWSLISSFAAEYFFLKSAQLSRVKIMEFSHAAQTRSE